MSDERDYYVSMIRGETKKQYALMAGPFSTHDEALKMVDAAWREAERLDPRCHFDAFGTYSKVRSPDNKPGWLNVYLGVKPRETA